MQPNIEYGKVTTIDSYHNGKKTATEVISSPSTFAGSIADVVHEFGTALLGIRDIPNRRMTFEVYADEDPTKPLRIVKSTQLERITYPTE